MRAVLAIVFAASFVAGLAQESTTDGFNDKINSIDGKPSVRLDPYIRKALLKALTELEENDQSTIDDENVGTSTIDTEILKSGDEITEALPTESTKEGIQIHSFIVNGQTAFENNSTNKNPAVTENRISILSTTAGNVENQVADTLPTQIPFNEIFQTRESGINLQQVRSIKNTASQNDVKIATRATITTRKPTTTTTTTTTTPKPTHNNDGENIEEVEKGGVQVFQAPLVAAFTVHQDAQGLPKKVIPIYQQPSRELPLKPLASVPTETPVTRHVTKPLAEQTQNFIVHRNPNTEFINQQLALQKQLEEKQRYLEEQLRQLQFQQRQQEEWLRKQQFLLQQKDAQRQQQLIQDQQRHQNIQPINSFTQQLPHNNFQNNFQNQNNGIRPQNTVVSIQPSLPLEQSNAVASQQQLPNREAVDFLLHLRNQQSEQFPLQENHLPQGIGNFLQPAPLQNFQQNSFNSVRPVEDPFRAKQNTRVFRQESGVGNFGFNNVNQNQNYNNNVNQNQNNNRFNTFSPIYSNRFFPFTRQFTPDVELKQLLLQSDVSGRGHEDINIVSKVLSLNHGIPNNNVSNRLPFDSRRQVRPF